MYYLFGNTLAYVLLYDSNECFSPQGTPQETEELIRNDQEFPHLSEIDTSMVEPICEDRKVQIILVEINQ